MEGDNAGLVGGEDEESVTGCNIVRGEGNLHTIVDCIKDVAEKAHNLVIFGLHHLYCKSRARTSWA